MRLSFRLIPSIINHPVKSRDAHFCPRRPEPSLSEPRSAECNTQRGPTRLWLRSMGQQYRLHQCGLNATCEISAARRTGHSRNREATPATPLALGCSSADRRQRARRSTVEQRSRIDTDVFLRLRNHDPAGATVWHCSRLGCDDLSGA